MGVNTLRLWVTALGIAAGIAAPNMASADEGGVSFWIPGFFGSLAATPQQAGFSITEIYYHTSVNAGGSVPSHEMSRSEISPRTSAAR
jgi:hypothetical protein